MQQAQRMTAVCLLFVSTAACSAQSLKDLAAKAKQKMKDAAAAATGQTPANGQGAPTTSSASGANGQGAPTTASASGANGDRGHTGYTFCIADKVGVQMFVSAVFAWGNGRYDYAGTQALSAEWSKYATGKFGINHPSTCEDASSYPTEALALKRQTDVVAGYTSGRSSQYSVVQTGWTPVSAGSSPSGAGNGPPTQIGTVRTVASENLANGTTENFTFCLANKGRTQLLFSEVFPWGDGNFHSENRQQLLEQWRKFVAERYKAESARCEHAEQLDEQSARKKKAETKAALSTSAGHQPDIETGWTPSGSAPSSGNDQPQTHTNASSSGNPPDATLKEEIDRAQKSVVPFCQNTEILTSLLDCSCMADAVYAARLKGPTTISHGAPTSHGPSTILNPPLGPLVESLDLRSCSTKEKVDSYSMKRTTNTLRTSVKEPRLSELGACVAQRFSGQVASDPKALTHIEIIDNDFTSNLSFCNQKIR